MIGYGFPILIGWLLPAIFGQGFLAWTLWVGIPVLIIGLIAPGLLRQPCKLWMVVGSALGWVISYIILGFAFIVVLQPIAYILRLFGYDPLRKQKHHGSFTYREERKSIELDFSRSF